MLYDVFLSHNHADKDWTRALFERLSGMDYDGRMLRAWLDERVLDPGNLSSSASSRRRWTARTGWHSS
jgi:hypothetical protein